LYPPPTQSLEAGKILAKLFCFYEGNSFMNSAIDIWAKTLELLSRDLTQVAISTWFDDCSAVDFSDNTIFLHTPSEFKKSQIETRWSGSIKSVLFELFSGHIDVVILDDDGLAAMNEASKTPDYLGIDEYTFEHFVVGSSNRFAHAAAVAVSEIGQKQGYNPLFIYGESGLGKTHLLYAIRHAVESKYPHFRVIYVKGEDFTNDMIAAIQQKKNIEFREKYRGADFFLIDDIQFIAGKEGVQEEFFHTFNTLYELGKQIVLTSDRPPKEMYTLEDRLRTRFESGLNADIHPPDEALRVAIIRNKAAQLGVILPEDVTAYIAENLDSSVRQLEGAVKMIIAYRDIMDDDITVESVKERLKDMFKGEKDLIPTTDSIIEETGKFFAVTPNDMKGESRVREIVLARQVAMYLIRKITNLSLIDTGRVFNRDHSTVVTSTNKITAKINNDKSFSGIIRDITSNINSKI